MATKSRKRRPTRKSNFSSRRRAPVRRRATTRSKPQEIRIVIEQPQPSFGGLSGALPESVGAVAATTPRRSRF